RFFLESVNAVFNERDIYTDKGERVKIDRMIIKEEQIDIIDYKSTYVQDMVESHKEQVNNYKKIVEELYPDKTIEGYIVFIKECDILKV
ncbi:MAG: hypothetical protein PHQ52_07745, partial [Candidatus Omnitrophica bacterium]|nr:hypothetical protein [Candidatus Omnitrophota bacterium]